MSVSITSKGAMKFALFLMILAFIALSLYLAPIASPATSEEESSVSNVTINKQVAISRSNNLTAGILFGTADPGTNNLNATGNFNDTDYTQYWLTMDSTTNTPIDVCVKANAALTSGSNTIALTNYHWSNSTSTSSTLPLYPATTDVADTYGYAAAFNDTDSGTTTPFYFRFSLDIPSSTKAGTYNNSVYFKATDNETTC